MFKLLISGQFTVITKLLFFLTVTTGFIACSTSSKVEQPLALKQDKIRTEEFGNVKKTNLVQEIHRQINQYRRSLNLPPLGLNAQVSEVAAVHSRNMAEQKVKFSHQGFDNRTQAIKAQISYRSVAENVAYNQGYSDPVSQAVAGWIKSKGHRQNIVGNYNLTGIGVAKNQQGEYYFTQIFILKN